MGCGLMLYQIMNFPPVDYAKTRCLRNRFIATILQPNLSSSVRLRQKSEGKARLFLSGDDKNEHLFGFRDQKVAGSNPVTSTKNRARQSFLVRLFLYSLHKITRF